MIRILFPTAFLLGAIVVTWMALDFVGSDLLALMVTVVIGGVYVIGFIEQVQYRKVTATLAQALDNAEAEKGVSDLGRWLEQLHPSLRNSVRLRIEGERVGLPAPVLTPYLVGLLVMLGLMGTFVGMVITLKGAVVALEGTTELQAIREGLTAPIGGLGLAFGTSVAGVAASAMLGLISTLSRRERLQETNRLDGQIATVFRDFSLVHNRQETFKAMQYQAEALPQVAEKLQAMSQHLETIGDRLSDRLLTNQEQFHDSVHTAFSSLAQSVEQSLKASLSDSNRLAVESIQPLVTRTLEQIKEESRSNQQQLQGIAEQQLAQFEKGFTNTSEKLTQSWQQITDHQDKANGNLLEQLGKAFTSFSDQFQSNSEAVISSFKASSQQWIEDQQQADSQRLEKWHEALSASQSQSAERLDNAADQFNQHLQRMLEQQQSSLTAMTDDLKTLSSDVSGQMKELSSHTLAQHKSIGEQLDNTSKQLTQNATEASNKVVEELGSLLQSSEQLVQSRMESESAWIEGQEQRIETLAASVKAEFSQLREEEAQRGNAAVEQLSQLEASVSQHLAQLGQSLEAPMTRLMETASEAPKAAAAVIEQLRGEISKNIERDNGLLEERRQLMEELNGLLGSMEKTSAHQREAIETMVRESNGVMKEVSTHFSDQVNNELEKVTDMADQFQVTATEMSALGESFQLAVKLFSESNQELIEKLNRIEESLNTANTRSDEQLAYYIGQAREIIDHSMMSQKEILEEMRLLGRQADMFASEQEQS